MKYNRNWDFSVVFVTHKVFVFLCILGLVDVFSPTSQSFERLMTFYTPDLSSGPPGSFPSVQIVPAEHVPGERYDVMICLQYWLLPPP